MKENDAVKAYLDSLAEEYNSNLPGPGEYTNATFREEMSKRGANITFNVAARMLRDYVKDGLWSEREGRDVFGRKSKIYKPMVH